MGYFWRFKFSRTLLCNTASLWRTCSLVMQRLSAVAVFAAAALGLDNAVGRTPVLGFNSWTSFACQVNETLMRDTIDLVATLGLRDAGFEYVSVDDCWASSRDPATGTIQADPATFPSGMAALADYAHARQLKFGLYSSNSPNTCAGRPGSYGYETLDASTYAAWGIDLLKYDNCGDQATIGQPEARYPVMRDALNASGRQIIFAACEWAVDFPATWMAPVAHSWRATYDSREWSIVEVSKRAAEPAPPEDDPAQAAPVQRMHTRAHVHGRRPVLCRPVPCQPHPLLPPPNPNPTENMWECVVPHLDWLNVYADFAGPGHFNDGDILESFNGVLTTDESVAQLALWAAIKSPLLIGCDLRLPACTAGVPYFTNPELLAISQDALGAQARRVAASGGDKGVPHGKSGTCGAEELPQNTVIAPCDADDARQRWALLPNGTLFLAATGECLQLDSGQGGSCSQNWDVWYNNAASSLCNDPASSCGGRQELWAYDAAARHLVNNASSQCLTVHASALHNVGLLPCSGVLSGLQTWDWTPASGQFISSAAPPGAGNSKFCLARSKDVLGGALETWAGPLANGDLVVILFNRNGAGPVPMTASWPALGLDPAKRMAVRDVLARADNGTAAGAFTTAAPVPVHGVAMLRLSAA